MCARFEYNVGCLFGQEGCEPDNYLLAWGLFVVGLAGVLFIAYQLRYSEGANFFIMAMVTIGLTHRTTVMLVVFTKTWKQQLSYCVTWS